MSYVKRTLLPEEEIVYFTKPHYIVLFRFVIWIILASFAFKHDLGMFIGPVLLVAAVLTVLNSLIAYFCSEYAITNKRILVKTGFIGGKSLEIFLNRKVTNMFRISFGTATTPSEAESLWKTIIDITISFCTQLDNGLDGGLKNTKTVNSVMRTFRSLVQATSTANKTIYENFAKKIKAP